MQFYLVSALLLWTALPGQANDIVEEIYNGYDAQGGQIPWQVLLISCKADSTCNFCGGVLISPSWVATACHCVYNIVSSTVYLGLTNTSNGTGVSQRTVGAGNCTCHSTYSPSTYVGDIALVNIAQVTLSAQIQIVALSKMAWISPGTFDNYNVTASGWGKTNDTETGIHQILQYRLVRKMVQTSCVNFYVNILPVTNCMICTDKISVYSGPCSGDSGGPLTVLLTTGRRLIALVSWGAGECSQNSPVVYTYIACYLNWISTMTGIPVN